MKRSVIIVDDHTLFAQSLKNLINSFYDFEVTQHLKNGQEFINYLESGKPEPQMILLDIRMPVMNGMETMAEIKAKYPHLKVLALTMDDDERVIIKMVKLGCGGYLLKDIEPEELETALNSVLRSGYYFNKEVTVAMKNRNRYDEVHSLTEREKEFLRHACTEMTYKEVADQMNLSPKTIDGYRETLFHKLEVKNRVGLVLYAVKNRMVEV